MIHELGHFLAAKVMGIGVIEFSLGMGPRICSKVMGDVRYSLRLLPFGGSCMMLGEETDEEYDCDDEDSCLDELDERKSDGRDSHSGDYGSDARVGDNGDDDRANHAATRSLHISEFNNGTLEHNERSFDGDYIEVDGRRYSKDAQFVNKAAWRRFIVIAAGPVFNFILAFLLSFVVCAWLGFDRPFIREVEVGSPAEEAGLEPEDRVYALSVNGDRMSVQCSRDMQVFMYIHADELNNADTFTVYYRDASDGNARKQAVMEPFYDSEKERYRLGFSYNVAYESTGGIVDTLICSQYNVNYCVRSSIESIKLLAGGRVSRQDVMGPVRMVAVMDESVTEAADYGLKSSAITLLDLMILISGSLGFMNLLPLPALDGGRLIFITIELITRRAVPKELEAKIHAAGMILLLGLMLIIMVNDVLILRSKGANF